MATPVVDVEVQDEREFDGNVNEQNSDVSLNSHKTKKKSNEQGIVYLSYIPPSMNVQRVREALGVYGEVGRLFLQPGKSGKNGKPSRYFTEGWVEFQSKKVAKRVASALNGNQVGGKRKHPWYDSLWSIKYLHRFQWTHLNERLSYEKAVRDQRVRTEISQAKKESNFYTHSVDQAKRKNKTKATSVHPKMHYQTRTDQEMCALRKVNHVEEEKHCSILKNVFGSEMQ